MAKLELKSVEIKLALQNKGLNYKVKRCKSEDNKTECLTFIDPNNGTQVCGKIARDFNIGEVYYWSELKHDSLAPLIDVLNVRGDLNIFLTCCYDLTLKQIVHDEDFLYDARCFDRKRSYAKDILSGLSYLHGKSLCLMNLSDAKVGICKLYDKAVITDFSCLINSRKTTKSKLKILDFYKPPEAEKGEFDAISAELWTSGILILNMFLAHEVPWEVIDYKPKRIMELVNKLPLEMLQVTNIGSIVNFTDLQKFKAFLKCFFKLNPASRVTAGHASIASFLIRRYTEFRDTSFQSDFGADTTMFSDINIQNKEYLSSSGTSESLHPKRFLPQIESTQFSCIEKSPFKNSFATMHPESKAFDTFEEQSLVNGRQSPMDVVVPTIDSQRLKEENNKNCTSQEIFPETRKQQENESPLIVTPSSFSYKSEDSIEVFNVDGFQDAPKDSPKIENVTGIFSKSSSACYQTKPSLVKSKSVDESKLVSFKVCTRKNLSHSKIESLSVNPSSASDLCLNRLFEDHDAGKEFSVNRKAETNQNNFELIRPGEKGMQNVIGSSESAYGTLINSNGANFGKIYKDIEKSGLFKEPDLRSIRDKLVLIEKCHNSAQNHLKIFISSEFNFKQRKILNEYQLLLYNESLIQCDRLKKEYERKLDELFKLGKSLSSVSNYLGNYLDKSFVTRNRDYTVNQDRFLETEKVANDTKRMLKNTHTANSKIRLRRQYSYYRAIRASEEQNGAILKFNAENKMGVQKKSTFNTGNKINEQRSIFPEVNESKEKLIGPVTKSRKRTVEIKARENKMADIKFKPCEAMPHVKQRKLHDIKKKGHKKANEGKRSFFSCFCRRGVTAESTASLEKCKKKT